MRYTHSGKGTAIDKMRSSSRARFSRMIAPLWSYFKWSPPAVLHCSHTPAAMKATFNSTLRTLQVTVQELGGMTVCMARHEEEITHLIVGSKCSTSNARTFKVPLYLPLHRTLGRLLSPQSLLGRLY